VAKLSGVSLSDLVELRCAVETVALTRAARAPIAEHLAEARQCLETMASADLAVSDFHAADVAFHVALVAASGNEALSAVMLAVKDAIHLHLDEALTPKRLTRVRAQLLEEHRGILQAVERGNGKSACMLLLKHLSFYGT
jgi:DNA-binding FadR family transcriptional regulator